MLLSKKIISLLLVLASVSLMGTGFSAWLINTNDSYTSVNGGIDVSDLFDVSEYIYFDTTNDSDGIIPFSYSEFSLLDSSGSATDTATIKIFLCLNIESCLSFFKTSTSIEVVSCLSINEETNLNLFNETYLKTTEKIEFTSKDKEGFVISPIFGTNRKFYENGLGLDTSFIMNDILINCEGVIKFALSYTFNIESDEFEKFVAPLLIRDKITFGISFMLKGV